MRRLLLLNPPFPRPVQRDDLCPHGVKADYYWPAIDLLLFGAAARGVAELHWVDAIASRLSRERSLEAAVAVRPDDVFAVVSSITLAADLEFLGALRSRIPGLRVWASGDAVSFGGAPLPGVDVRVLDFTNRPAIREVLGGSERGVVTIPEARASTWSVGVCPHELTRSGRYALPWSLHPRITTVATNHGCPFRCTFCNSNALPFKRREIAEVLEELAAVERLGFREVLFRDFTFNASDADALCEGIRRKRIRLAWSCWTSASLVDGDVLRGMKAAGCYLVSYGVESGVDRVLAESRRPAGVETVRRAVAASRGVGLEVLTSFVLGLPGDDPARSRALLRELAPDYLSLNLLAPRLGSALQLASARAATGEETDSLLAGGAQAVRERDAIEREFYLRPRQLLRYARLATRSPYRAVAFARSGAGLVARWLRGTGVGVPPAGAAGR